eukprot:SAG11_NODE_2572_length_3210_cov_18.286725_2_plen_158_part_00
MRLLPLLLAVSAARACGTALCRQQEAAEINSSLMCLKQCVRGAAAAQRAPGGEAHVPYRQAKLTQLLKAAFQLPPPSEAHNLLVPRGTLVVATLSPSSADTEHSLSTLSHGAALITEESHRRCSISEQCIMNHTITPRNHICRQTRSARRLRCCGLH